LQVLRSELSSYSTMGPARRLSVGSRGSVESNTSGSIQAIIDAGNEPQPRMSDDPSAGLMSSRRHQIFPELTDAEIARIRRFGVAKHYAKGERLITAGEPGPGMFVVLKGRVTLIQRGGLGHVVPLVTHGHGQFLGEVATLSGGAAFVDAHAHEDVETVRLAPEQLRALIVAEAGPWEGV